MEVEGFSDILRDEAADIWKRIFTHPFLIEMSEGRLPLDKFRFYVKQDYVYLIEFTRCLGLAAAKVDDLEAMRALASLLNAGLTVEVEMLEKLCVKLEIPLGELRLSELAPTNIAYTRHLLHVAYSGTVGEIIAAMLPCMWTYQEIGGMMSGSKPMIEHLIYHDWCATYRSSEYIDLVDWYRSLANRFALNSGTTIRERMRRHFILSSRFEYMFWDMAYRNETWPV